MSILWFIIELASRVELSSDLGFETLGTLAMSVLCLIALWIIECVSQSFSKKFLVHMFKGKEQRMEQYKLGLPANRGHVVELPSG